MPSSDWVDFDPSTLSDSTGSSSSSASSAPNSKSDWVDFDPSTLADTPKVTPKIASVLSSPPPSAPINGFWNNANQAIHDDVGAVLNAGLDPEGAYDDAKGALKKLTAGAALKMGVGGVGAMAGAESGAGIGAALGAPLAPFTMGASEPILAGLGGITGAGLGLMATNATTDSLQNGFIQSPEANQKMINQAGRDFGTGAISQAIGNLVASGGNVAAAKASQYADALDNSALGLRQGEISRSAINQGFDPVTDATKPANAVQTALDLGITSKGTSPLQLLKTADSIHADLNDQVSTILQGADNRIQSTYPGLKIFPKFDTAQNFIDNAKLVSVTQKAGLQQKLDDFKDAFKANTDGSVQYIQDQKQALYRNDYGDGVGAKNEFDLDKAIGHDLKTQIERTTDATLPPLAAGAVKDLNQQIGAFQELKIPLKRAAAGGQVANPLGSALKTIATTGGIGSASIASATTGNPLWLGAAIAGRLGLGLASTPTGKILTSNVLDAASGLQSLLPASEDITGPVSAILSEQDRKASQNPTESQENQSQIAHALDIPLFKTLQTIGLFGGPDKNDNTSTKPDPLFFSHPTVNNQVSSNTSTSAGSIPPMVLSQIKSDPYSYATAKTESNFNPTAMNIAPGTHAVGLFQFEPDIAAAYGLKDRLDPTASYKAFKELTTDNAKAIKSTDPVQLYAAHVLGATIVNRINEGIPLERFTPKVQAQIKEFYAKDLPNFQTNYKAALKGDA